MNKISKQQLTDAMMARGLHLVHNGGMWGWQAYNTEVFVPCGKNFRDVAARLGITAPAEETIPSPVVADALPVDFPEKMFSIKMEPVWNIAQTIPSGV